MPTPLTILQKTFVYLGFRGQQEAIIQHVTRGQNAFVVMPTGAEKSLCYQIPALCLEGVAVFALLDIAQVPLHILRRSPPRAKTGFSRKRPRLLLSGDG
jgi:hypothetical protein